MFWTVYWAIAYIDLAAVVLVAGYACYEYFWAWSHDEKFEPRLLTKIFSINWGKDELKFFHNLDFPEFWWLTGFSAVAVLVIAITWPVSLPGILIFISAQYYRERIRKEKKGKEDV